MNNKIMKKEELMIGDWFWWEAEGKKYPLQVTEKTFALYDEDVWNFEPIPLTTEILEKNGFEKAHRPVFSDAFIITNRVYWCNYTLFAHEENDISGDNAYIMCKCEYVHELQHALKLCRIEKEIVL